jgi:signal transduction histidine kinase
MVGELSVAIAHELNQPLAAILTNVGAARRYLSHDPPNLVQVREIIDAIREVGPGAQAAVPTLIRIIDDRRVPYLHDHALDALGRIGPGAAAAKGSVLRLITRDSDSLPKGLWALSMMSLHLDGDEFSRMNRLYREECKEAGSIPFFSYSRDDDCATEAAALSSLARASGQGFEEVGWR